MIVSALFFAKSDHKWSLVFINYMVVSKFILYYWLSDSWFQFSSYCAKTDDSCWLVDYRTSLQLCSFILVRNVWQYQNVKLLTETVLSFFHNWFCQELHMFFFFLASIKCDVTHQHFFCRWSHVLHHSPPPSTVPAAFWCCLPWTHSQTPVRKNKVC